ncbi:MAG TPA: hypothetical protein VM689_24160 [Aliidongia sp.]|nr:hypothetical protein [Aliidongia sp.]
MAEIGKDLAAGVRGEGRATRLDIAFAVADLIALVIDAPTHGNWHAYAGSQGLQALGRGLAARYKVGNVKVRANPWFVANGHDERESPDTQTYLRNRDLKTFSGAVVSFAGNLGEFVTAGVNTSGTVQHLSAAVSTSGHLLGIRAIARSYKNTATIARWCDAIIKMKSMKLGERTLQIVADVLPIPIADQVVNIAAVAAALGYKVGLSELCYATAIEIHWRAFQEQVIAGSAARNRLKVGPATQIFHEIFTRRALTAALGSYDVAKLIREPAGWMALGDKLVQA